MDSDAEYFNDEDTKNLLALLGLFVVRFEEVCFAMRECIKEIFYKGELKDYGFSDVVTAGKSSNELQLLLGALYYEYLGLNSCIPCKKTEGQKKEDHKCVKNLIKRIKKITEKRNELLHSKWALNYQLNHSGEESVITITTVGQNKGSQRTMDTVKSSNLKKYVDEAHEISQLLSKLQTCICKDQNVFNEIPELLTS